MTTSSPLRAVAMIDGCSIADRDAFLAALAGHRRPRARRQHRPHGSSRPVRSYPKPVERRPVYPDVAIVGQVIPEGFADTLRRLRDAKDPRLSMTLRLAAEEGWTFGALAVPLGISREAVRQRATRAAGNAIGIDIPLPPRQQKPIKVKPLKPRLAEPVARRLRDMWAQVRKLHGLTPADDPVRRVAVRLAAELAAVIYEDGIPAATVAKALGVSRSALSFRLGRYGHRNLPPSQRSAVYKGGPSPRYQADECGRGHQMSGENLRITKPGGVRVCRACERIRAEKYRAKQRKAEVAA